VRNAPFIDRSRPPRSPPGVLAEGCGVPARVIITAVRRVFPEPAGVVSIEALYGDPLRPPVGGRPWVGVCMVASLDGSTVVAGRSGGLSNPDDVAVLATLRRAADAIIVGASTVRVEGYGPPSTPGQRIGVVTATGNVDPTSELFRRRAGFLIMPEDGPPPPTGPGGPIDVVRAGRGRVDLPLALSRLDQAINVPTFVQAEGGPHLNGALLDADCVDELDVTISPVLAGGDGPRVTAGAAATVAPFDLAHLAIDDRSFLFTRWLRRRAS
jgi:riboflavin biosynthesis pyrimidine reductase